jgi:hypothetical protein
MASPFLWLRSFNAYAISVETRHGTSLQGLKPFLVFYGYAV